jgi:hypothetical protein
MPKQKAVRPYFKNKSGMVEHTYGFSYSEGRNRSILVQGQPRQKIKTLYEKQTEGKNTGDLAQAIKHLPNKARPSSSPSTSTTTTTKRQGEGIMFESFQVIF